MSELSSRTILIPTQSNKIVSWSSAFHFREYIGIALLPRLYNGLLIFISICCFALIFLSIWTRRANPIITAFILLPFVWLLTVCALRIILEIAAVILSMPHIETMSSETVVQLKHERVLRKKLSSLGHSNAPRFSSTRYSNGDIDTMNDSPINHGTSSALNVVAIADSAPPHQHSVRSIERSVEISAMPLAPASFTHTRTASNMSDNAIQGYERQTSRSTHDFPVPPEPVV